MLPIATIWRPIAYGISGVALVAALVAAYAWNGWNRAAEQVDTLNREIGTVVVALRTASDNPKADWKTAPGQIIALG